MRSMCAPVTTIVGSGTYTIHRSCLTDIIFNTNASLKLSAALELSRLSTFPPVPVLSATNTDYPKVLLAREWVTWATLLLI